MSFWWRKTMIWLKQYSILKISRLMMINFLGLCEGVVGVGNLGCNWVEFYFFIEVGLNFFLSYFVLDFVHVRFVLKG
jgi:hypothetical protein